MSNYKVSIILLLCVLSQRCASSKIFAGIFPNWVQYRHTPFKFSAKDLQGIVGRLDHFKYAYAYFSTQDYQVKFTDPHDEDSLQMLMDYKLSHPHIKILASIGGENFPSSYFSDMVSSNQTIAWFISSLQAFLEEYSFDTVDISWKWPCSSSKTIYRKRYENQWRLCNDFEETFDKGSRCPDDDIRFLYLLEMLREDLGNATIITVTGSPDPQFVKRLPLRLYSKHIDYWYVETFGYATPATNSSYLTAPAAPLNHPSINSGVSPHNINTTGMFPDLLRTSGGRSLASASVQGKCCGPYQSTFGGKPGRGSQACGMYMYSEIQAVKDMQYYYDKTTQTAIGYVRRNSSDGWTEAGTWISYNDRNSVQAHSVYK